MADDLDIKQSLAKLTDLMEQFLMNSLSGKRNQVNRSDEGKIELTGIEGLSNAIKSLTTDVQGLIRTLGGQPTGFRGPSGQVNANLSPRQLNYDPFTREPAEHFRYGNIPGAINSLIQRNAPSSFATRMNGEGEPVQDTSLRGNKAYYGLGAINTALNAVPAIRQEWNNVNAQMQASVDRRITNPTQLGMLAGYQGPGQEGVMSSTGSYLSSLFAAPSMVLSGGANPGMIGNLFGANMSPATQAGWQSQYRAFTRSLNPMDMLSYGQSLGINQAVAAKGFRSLGQQVSVEDAVTQIVQSTAIDAGTAIDTMDLVIKRLHGDVSDANDMLKTFGTLAVGAGKGVNQFAQEANQVMSGLSMQGAQGTGALQGGAAYSMFTGISGPAMSQFLNSPQLGGLMAAQIMAGGGKFANQSDMMSLAMGFPQGMGGGQDAIGVFGKQVDSVVGLVDTFKKQGYNEQMAIQLAASTTGQQPFMIQQIYKQGPGIVKEQGVLKNALDLKTGYSRSRETAASRRSNAISEDVKDPRVFGGVRRGGQAALGEIKRMTREGGVDFDRVNISDKDDPNFEDKVQRLYSAHMSGDMQEIKNVLNQIENEPGTNIDKVKQAVNLLVSSGKSGAKESGDWKKLASAYGITVDLGAERTPGGGIKRQVWDSTKGGSYNVNKMLSAATPIMDRAVEAGLITKKTEAKWKKEIEAGKLDPNEFYKRLNDKETQKRLKDEGGVSIKLEGDAAKYFKLFQGDSPGSNQRYVKPPSPSGYDNRTGG